MIIVSILLTYLVFSGLIGWLAYMVCNPYGHLTKHEQIKQALDVFAFWPYYLYRILRNK